MQEFDENAMAAAQEVAEAAPDDGYQLHEQVRELQAQVDAYGLLLQQMLIDHAIELRSPTAAIDQLASRIGARLHEIDVEDGEELAHISEFLRAARKRLE